MGSGDEIAVARPGKMPNGYSGERGATASSAAVEDGKAGPNQVSERPPEGKERQEAAAVAAVDLTGNSSRSASPLSDVDKEILEEPPNEQLQELASDEGRPAIESQSNSPANKPSDSSELVAIASSSPPKTAASSKPKRKLTFVNMFTPTEPPTKRRRGRPPKKTQPTDSASRDEQGVGARDELALDDTYDDLDLRPTKKVFLSGGASRLSARTRGQAAVSERLPASARLREKTLEKEQYAPLHLYEKSNWVLFDPVKSFPSTLANPPTFLKRYTHYKPGNRRILEYNLVSNSVRVKSTPRALRGKPVNYGSNGPQLK